jgi:hypothetical protein
MGNLSNLSLIVSCIVAFVCTYLLVLNNINDTMRGVVVFIDMISFLLFFLCFGLKEQKWLLIVYMPLVLCVIVVGSLLLDRNKPATMTTINTQNLSLVLVVVGAIGVLTSLTDIAVLIRQLIYT